MAKDLAASDRGASLRYSGRLSVSESEQRLWDLKDYWSDRADLRSEPVPGANTGIRSVSEYSFSEPGNMSLAGMGRRYDKPKW